ncbi:MAG: peptide chain release factor N(5)-glutamine methyltransferase [Pyrinomonadaceae bacterium]
MSLSIAQAVLEATPVLRAAGVPEASREAGSLLAHTLARDGAFIITHSDEALSEQFIKMFREYVARRAAGEPLQYITGHQAFFNLDFEVTRDVLIPRPETELLVEVALDLLSGADESSVCDVGTGSGCIAITILRERLSARAVGLDISLPALQVAQKNASRHGVADRFRLVASDRFSSLDTGQSFSMIVSNPPYVSTAAFPELQREVREYEPRTALLAGSDGLSVIRRLLEEAHHYLVESGYFLFEIGFDQHEMVERLIDTSRWELLEIHKDLQGIPRTVALRRK